MKILLIIPCFNEGSRLDLKRFDEGCAINRSAGIELSFLFADDGSTDETRQIVEAYCTGTNHFSFHAPQNQGKGNVIQSAYQSIKNPLEFDWIGYWDVDLATPLEEIPKMIKFLSFYPDDISSIWGSRVSRLGSVIKRDMHRHYLGRIFVTLVSMVLKVRAYDSQCGAKLFKPVAARLAFQEPFLSRWIFDVEILLRLNEEAIVEYPLLKWQDVPGSKVKVFKEIFRVGWHILQIRKKYKSNIQRILENNGSR